MGAIEGACPEPPLSVSGTNTPDRTETGPGPKVDLHRFCGKFHGDRNTEGSRHDRAPESTAKSKVFARLECIGRPCMRGQTIG